MGCGVVPSAADDVVIVVAGGYKVSFTSSATVASVRIGDASVNQGRTVSLEDGGALTVTGGIELNAFGRLDVRTATLTAACACTTRPLCRCSAKAS